MAAVLAAAAVAAGLTGFSRLAAHPAPQLAATPHSGTTGLTALERTAPPSGPLTTKQIAARVDPGLVDVNVVFGYAGARGSATGMVLTPSGLVLTNNHVVQGASTITVTDVGNGKTYAARVLGYARTSDVALLQLQGASGLQTVPLGDSAQLARGARVVALGNAGGRGGTPRAAVGSVLSLGEAITAVDAGGGNAERLHGLIRTDAPIQPGDSGGPLVNDSGQVVGMNAAASAHYVQTSAPTEGFAIPINTALTVADQIQAGSTSATVHVGPTGFLGVQVVPAQQSGEGLPSASGTSGALVGGVLPGYPAAKAGLTAGDVITSVDGQRVSSATALTDLLTAHHPGDTVQLHWVDQTGQAHSSSVKLASGPPA